MIIFALSLYYDQLGITEIVLLILSTALISSNLQNKILFNNQSKLHKIITLKFPKSLKFPGHYLFNSFRYSSRTDLG